MIFIEYWLDSNTLILGDGKWVTVKVDDQLGTIEREEFQWRAVQVLVYINDSEHDVTAAISQRTLDEWKELLLEKGRPV